MQMPIDIRMYLADTIRFAPNFNASTALALRAHTQAHTRTQLDKSTGSRELAQRVTH